MYARIRIYRLLFFLIDVRLFGTFDAEHSTSMTSLQASVQEFIDHHSATLFPANSNELAQPLVSRSYLNPWSSTIFEDEDPSSFGSSSMPLCTLIVSRSVHDHATDGTFPPCPLSPLSRAVLQSTIRVWLYRTIPASLLTMTVDSSWTHRHRHCTDCQCA